MSSKSDLELGETYAAAERALVDAERAGDTKDIAYWTVLRKAIVDEATSRTAFGQDAFVDMPGRRLKKRRQKVLKPLFQAREANKPDGP